MKATPESRDGERGMQGRMVEERGEEKDKEENLR